MDGPHLLWVGGSAVEGHGDPYALTAKPLIVHPM